ncbi:MAG: DUF2332 domain-containing protein [Acidimicrobiales bacterium]
MDDAQALMVEVLRANALQWREDGSPFYGELSERIADDVEAGGPTWDVLSAHAVRPKTELPAIRMLDAVHRLVLSGAAPGLMPHYPSTGGDGDAAAAWPSFLETVADHPDALRRALDQPPQTNDVGRCPAVIGGLLTVAAEAGLPVRLLELGSSAGLLLRCDHYRYEASNDAWGDPASPVRFVDPWLEGVPPLDAPLRIVERRGVDRHPLDPSREEDRLGLLSFVWPDELPRFDLLRSALEVAARFPSAVEQGSIPEWLRANLTPLPTGAVTVVLNSYAWMYLDDESRASTEQTLDDAAASASSDAPLAHLAFEALDGDYNNTQLRLTLWPGGEERLLGLGGAHAEPVRWLA